MPPAVRAPSTPHVRAPRRKRGSDVDLGEVGAGERRHPWEVVRAEFFRAVLQRNRLLPTPAIVDVGAGDGWLAYQLLDDLPPDARVVCWDINYTDADLALTADPRVSWTRTPPDAPAPLALLLDVVEHVEDDHAFLSDAVGRCVAPGGHALISVPAWPSLFSEHDVFLHHHRRYRPQALRALARSAGLEPVEEGGLFTSLIPVRGATVLRERLTTSRTQPQGAGHWGGGPRATQAVGAALRLDAAVGQWSARHRVPTPGLSAWLLARRPW